MDPIPPRPPSPLPRSQSVPPAGQEQAALDMFKDNMDQADPTGLLRALGEFFQTFSAKPERMGQTPSGSPPAPPRP